jgi:4-amino-4-deoxy-L-arabinose transferase-like glycosyltransferase
MIMAYFAVFNLVLHLVAIKSFGYFRDELYYISCSDHLSFGYVDHPPLAMLLLKIIRVLFGDSLIAIRFLPVLSGAAIVFLAGLLARELGGKKFSIILACSAAFAPLGNFFLFHIYSMNFLDHLAWMALFFICIRIIKTGEPKYWLWFGIAAGLGLQNKISILFAGFGVLAGLPLTRQRKWFMNKYTWWGGLIAGVLFLPYVLWNFFHHWPTLEFMRNASMYKITAVSPLEFFKEQILYNNPVTLFVWLAGLWYFFFHREGKTYRLFGWMYVAIYLLFTLQQTKAYYLAPVYPILFAGGSVLIESWLRRGWKWLRPAAVVFIMVPTLLLCPLTLPILPVEDTIRHGQWTGVTPGSGENHGMGPLPQLFADMHGWEELTEKVAGVYNSLSGEEKKECIIYGGNYGVTGAVNFFGKRYGLPPAFSGHNNHFFWPPRGYTGNVMIIIGGNKEDHEKSFREVVEVDRTDCYYCMPYENNKPIYLCRGITRSLEEIWPRVKHFM